MRPDSHFLAQAGGGFQNAGVAVTDRLPTEADINSVLPSSPGVSELWEPFMMIKTEDSESVAFSADLRIRVGPMCLGCYVAE